MRRILVLINPAAGNRRAAEAAVRGMVAHRSLHVELMIPDAADRDEQRRAAAEAFADGVDAVLVHGGDGAIHGAVNLLDGRKIPLGVVPAGSGNDFARAMGLERGKPREVLQRLLAALEQETLPTTEVDLLQVTTATTAASSSSWAVNSVNVGFDAMVNQTANALKRTPTSLRYLHALAKEVPNFRPITFTIREGDAVPVDRELVLVCVQNGPFIGGGIPLAPHASTSDGWAEASFVTPVSRAGLLMLFPLVLARRHALVKPLATRRVQQIGIEVPAGVPVFADGDELVTSDHDGCAISIEVRPGSLQLLTPTSG